MGKPAGAVWMGGFGNVGRLRKATAPVVLSFMLLLAFGVGGGFGSVALGAATTVSIISGDIQVRHGATAAFVSATDGEVLVAGDTVRTGDGSRAILTYFEGSTVSIEPNSELTLETASALKDGSTVVIMQQNFGRTWHVVTKLITGNSKYEVKTPSSTASVRGTAFEVDSDAERTVVTTTEGTVVDRVADPERTGQTVEIPVPAGKTHEQKRNAAPAPAVSTPEAESTLTITLDDQSSLVIDAQGRKNGIDKNGKKHLETPGAKLVTKDGKLHVVLPNVSDGRLEAQVRKAGGGDVDVETTLEDKGKEPVKVQTKVSTDTSGQGRASVDVKRSADGKTDVKQSNAKDSNAKPSNGKKP
jgi:ferric-dicitrate binding protein FerR (iron transport regulator)